MSRWVVPQRRWSTFCSAFSQEHGGAPVDVTAVETRQLEGRGPEPELAGDVLAVNRPLQEIREARRGTARDVVVTVRDEADATSFLVEDVVRLVEDPPSAQGSGLRIDTRDGVTALVSLRG